MAYDLKSLKVPRMMGAPLRTMVSLMERDSTRQLLAPVLVRELEGNLIKSAEISQHPTFLPVHPPGRSMNLAQAKVTSAFYEQPEFEPHPGHLPSGFALAEAYRNGKTSPTRIAEAVIANISASNEGEIPLNAVVITNDQDIRSQAKASKERFARGKPLSWLDGIPVVIKDEIDALPYATMVGTEMIGQDASANQDATAVARLRAAGAIIIGKANMHEIGIGVTGANITYGHCHNPYNLSHYAGGSSSGSAAAVAAGICPLALGADGGGSIRIPAALCGVVGLKPTWGRVSEFGAFPLCWSVAHIGPIGMTVDDVALAYSVIAGSDLLDSYSCNQPNVHLSQYLNADLSDIKVGVYAPWFSHAEREIVQHCHLAVEKLKELGASIEDVVIGHLNLQRIAHALIISSEIRASVDNLHREHPENFALDTRLILAISKLFNSTDYIKAQQIRSLAIQEFEQAFQHVDIIVTPTTAMTAPKIKNMKEDCSESNLSTTSKLMRFCYASNLTGLPALTIPVAYDDQGLPIGLQLIGKPWHEHQLLRVGRALEAMFSRQPGKLAFNLLAGLR